MIHKGDSFPQPPVQAQGSAQGARLAAYGFSTFAAPGACPGKSIALYRFLFMRLMTVV
jgi:hypothetical protein